MADSEPLSTLQSRAGWVDAEVHQPAYKHFSSAPSDTPDRLEALYNPHSLLQLLMLQVPIALARPTEVMVSLEAVWTSVGVVVPAALWISSTQGPLGARQSSALPQ